MVVNIISNWFLAGYLKYWPAHQGSLNYVSCFASNTGMLAQSSAVLADITRQQWPAMASNRWIGCAEESWRVVNPQPLSRRWHDPKPQQNGLDDNSSRVSTINIYYIIIKSPLCYSTILPKCCCVKHFLGTDSLYLQSFAMSSANEIATQLSHENETVITISRVPSQGIVFSNVVWILFFEVSYTYAYSIH